MSTTTRPTSRLRRPLAIGATTALAAGLIALGATTANATPPAGCDPTTDISYSVTGTVPAQIPANSEVDTGLSLSLTPTNPACNGFMVLNRIILTTDADVPLSGLAISLTTGGVTVPLTFSGSGGTYTADYGPPTGFPVSVAQPVTATVDVPPGTYTLSVELIDADTPGTLPGVSATVATLGAVGLPIPSVAGPVDLTAGGAAVPAGLTATSAGVAGTADAAKPQGTPFSYSFSPALPAGVTFNAAAGTFVADATAVPGTYSVAVTATDILGQVSTSSVQLTITVAAAATTPPPATPTATASGGTPLANSGVMSWPLFALGAAAVLIGGIAVRARRRTQA